MWQIFEAPFFKCAGIQMDDKRLKAAIRKTRWVFIAKNGRMQFDLNQ